MVAAVEPLAFGMADRLLTASVQGGLAALAVWVICRTFRELPASLRATLWWLVSAKLLLALVPLPAVPVPVWPARADTSQDAASAARVGPGSTRGSGADPEAPPEETSLATWPPTSYADPGLGAADSALRRSGVSQVGQAGVGPGPSGRSGADPNAATRAEEEPAHRSSSPFTRAKVGALTFPNIVIALIGAWGLVLLVHGAVLLRGLRHVHGTLRRARMDVDLDADVVRLSPLVGLRVPPKARLSDEITVPQVVGLWRSVLLFPSATTLSADERAMALAHELMHVRRHDLAWGWGPALAERLFFFHPLARLASREYLLAREAACDAAVVRAMSIAPDAYGRLLVRLGIAGSEPALAASGASPSFSSLRRRLEMLPHAATARVTRRSLSLAAVVIVATIVPVQLVARHQSPPEVTPLTAQAAPPAPSVPVVAPPAVAPPTAPTALPPPPAAPAPAAPRPIAPPPSPPSAPASVAAPPEHFGEVRAIGSVVVLERQAQPAPPGTPFPSATPVEPASPFPQQPEPPRPAPVAAPFRSVTGVEPAVTFAQELESPPPPDTAAPATAKPFYTSEAMLARIAASREPAAQEPSDVAPAPAPPPATEQTARRMIASSTLSFLMQEEEAARARLREAERRLEEIEDKDAPLAAALAQDRARLEEILRQLHQRIGTAVVARQLEERQAAAPSGTPDAVTRAAIQREIERLVRMQRQVEAEQRALSVQQERMAQQQRILAAQLEHLAEALERARANQQP